jgi:hypothetical protein
MDSAGVPILCFIVFGVFTIAKYISNLAKSLERESSKTQALLVEIRDNLGK